MGTVPAAVEFWDVPWDLNLSRLDQISIDGFRWYFSLKWLEPRTLVEAATRFWSSPTDQAANALYSLMVIPDSYDGAKRRSVLAKIGKGLFNAVLSRAKLQLPFEGTDINLQNRAGCTKLSAVLQLLERKLLALITARALIIKAPSTTIRPSTSKVTIPPTKMLPISTI